MSMSTGIGTGTGTETQERPDVRTQEPGDHERLAHIVYDPKGQGRAAALLTEARVLGTPVEALCGKRWIPSRDPARFPVCPECKAIKDDLFRRAGKEPE
jgi:Protein of unknown function (DUF3039)